MVGWLVGWLGVIACGLTLWVVLLGGRGSLVVVEAVTSGLKCEVVRVVLSRLDDGKCKSFSLRDLMLLYEDVNE